MTANSWVTHATKGYSLKFKQVEKRRLETCSLVWVEFGKTFRDATFAEAAQMRKEKEREREGLVYYVEDKDGKMIAKPYVSELPDVTFKPPIGAQAAYVNERRLAFEANRFASEHVQ